MDLQKLVLDFLRCIVVRIEVIGFVLNVLGLLHLVRSTPDREFADDILESANFALQISRISGLPWILDAEEPGYQ